MNILGKAQYLSSFQALDYEAKYNARHKYIVTSEGELKLVETMYSKRFIFNPDGAELSEKTKNWEHAKAWEEQLREEYGLSGKLVLPPDKDGSLERSKRRAKAAINDYILSNDFDCFVTLTLNAEKIDRADYGTVIKKLSSFLDNRVRRKGLYYVGVPELHKRGGIHFHLLCNSSALKLVDSGTVSVSGHKRPIKVSTADRLGIALVDRHTVYNVADWTFGFSTAIMTYGERGALANYVGKYITKADEKIGGRWYLSGGKLMKPLYRYDRISFDDVNDYTYDFKCDGGEFKVVKYDKGN